MDQQLEASVARSPQVPCDPSALLKSLLNYPVLQSPVRTHTYIYTDGYLAGMDKLCSGLWT